MKTVYQGGQGEITEKKSRFIATVKEVASEEEAAAFIAEMKKKRWDARHNCSADGEPSQTAGRPMLDVLLREGIYNVAVVVTRYFGGTLLGTGGLVRAYQKSVQEGLSNCVLIEKKQGKLLVIQTDYNGLGKIQYILAQRKIAVIKTDYTEHVEIHSMVSVEEEADLTKEITEGTNGCARFVRGNEVEFAVIDNEIKIFEKEC